MRWGPGQSPRAVRYLKSSLRPSLQPSNVQEQQLPLPALGEAVRSSADETAICQLDGAMLTLGCR